MKSQDSGNFTPREIKKCMDSLDDCSSSIEKHRELVLRNRVQVENMLIKLYPEMIKIRDRERKKKEIGEKCQRTIRMIMDKITIRRKI